MKNLLFVFALMLGATFTSCGNATGNVSEADSTVVDSIDSISVDTIDSVVVDSVIVDSVVAE